MLRQFVKVPGEADSYDGLSVDYVKGKFPTLVMIDDAGEETERIALRAFNAKGLEACHALLVAKGFEKFSDADADANRGNFANPTNARKHRERLGLVEPAPPRAKRDRRAPPPPGVDAEHHAAKLRSKERREVREERDPARAAGADPLWRDRARYFRAHGLGGGRGSRESGRDRGDSPRRGVKDRGAERRSMKEEREERERRRDRPFEAEA